MARWTRPLSYNKSKIKEGTGRINSKVQKQRVNIFSRIKNNKKW